MCGFRSEIGAGGRGSTRRNDDQSSWRQAGPLRDTPGGVRPRRPRSHAPSGEGSSPRRRAECVAAMSRIVRINEVRDHVFLHVREVLGALQPEARELEWTILALGDTVAAEEPNRLDVLALEDQVQGSDTGLRMTFDELLRLAERFAQVVDGLFV